MKQKTYIKGSIKEAQPWNGQKKTVEGLNMLNGTSLTHNYDAYQDKYMFGLHERPITYQCIPNKKETHHLELTLLYVHSSFACILMGKRELVALLSLSFWCLVIIVWLFLAVP